MFIKKNKYDELIDQLISRKGSILVFVKTKRSADKMVKRLKEEDHSADAIHGDLRQSKRDRVINSFRKGVKRILIATDVAARGLDIPLIQHVINYDLPQVPEDYIHRIGRTARAGSEGSALTFLTRDDRLMWSSISKLINPNFKVEFKNSNKRFNKNKKNKQPFNKKRKFKDKKKFFNKEKNHSNQSRDPDGRKFKDKKKFFNKERNHSNQSRDPDGRKFKDKKKFFNKERNHSDQSRDPDGRKFKDKKKFFNKERNHSDQSRDPDGRKFNFKKGKKRFFKKKDFRVEGYTNNPKYLGKQKENAEANNNERKKFNFKKGKKRFKNRSRPISFKFKKHNRSRN